MKDDVPTLCRAIATGDAAAFALFYDTWFDVMYAEARRATGRDESACMDIVHDAMLRVMDRLPTTLQDRAQLEAWLRTVVRRIGIDHLRRELRRKERETRAVRQSTGDARARGAEEAAELRERLDWLRRALAECDHNEREVIEMRHRLGWTLRQIAARLGLTSGAVDGRAGRSLRRLAEKGKEMFDG